MSDTNEPQAPTQTTDSKTLGTVLSELEEKWSGPEFDAEMKRRKAAHRSNRKLGVVTTERDRLVFKIGIRYADCSLDNFRVHSDENRKSVSKLAAYLECVSQNVIAGNSLIFYGPCGVGKDHLMAAAMFTALEHGIAVNWANGLDWYGKVRDDIERTEQMIDSLVKPAVLAISDPVPPAASGKADGELTAWRIELLQRVVDARYRQLKPIWMTINVTGIKGLYERLSTPLADRLLHGAVGVQLTGETERKPGGAK